MAGTSRRLGAVLENLFLWYAAGEDWAPLSYEDRARLQPMRWRSWP